MIMAHFKNCRPYLCALYVIIIYMFATNLYCILTEGMKIEYGTYFDGEELVTMHKISLQQCICECKAKTNRCESLIYKRSFTSCRLNVQKAATHQEFSDQAGSIYVEMDNDVPGCEKYQMAATTDNSAVPFNQPACGKPQAKANATFMGNVYSNGSRIKYVCTKGFKQLDHTESVTVCLYNESWSEINFTCKPDTIAKSCRNDSECFELSTECRDNRCVCIRNYVYSMTEFACVPSRIGCENYLISDEIPDDQFTGSSHFIDEAISQYCYPKMARLVPYQKDNVPFCDIWAPKTLNKSEYIQVNLSKLHSVRAIITRGRKNPEQYVETYKVESSADGSSFRPVQGDVANVDVVFSGNKDPKTSVTNQLPCPVEAQYIRINPQTYHIYMSLQFDLIGCALNSADCDFQIDTCGWQHVNTSLKRWEHGRPNITQGTSPNDHTCSSGDDSTDAMNCNYMYVTSERQEHGNAQVTLSVRRSNTSRCLNLWHMASNDFRGSLNIITAKCEQAIEKLRNTTIINFFHQWNMSRVQVESGVYQIVIEGIWTRESRGVLMIDDIKMTENDCT
ncbi:hypothetical protein ACJMK2_020772 [Sinanodonta woodiana]|uniref:Uncharacterized protein n=1 Tax=Sinanodonta woodiana TaxID=1069815 RepID=A0ABD3U1I7_SINWO